MDELAFRLRFWRDHRWAPDRMSAYLDGELAARRRARMERHVDECPDCRGMLGGLRLVIDALHRLPPPAGSRGATEIGASVRVRLSEPPGS